MSNGQLRFDPIADEWIIFAPDRGKRPHDYVIKREEDEEKPYDESCPFCPGNEERLPSIHIELGNFQRNKTGVRVVANKFPIVKEQQSDFGIEESGSRFFHRGPGFGLHDVVIEHPQHDKHPARMSTEEMLLVVEAYHRRILELTRIQGIKSIVIFRNHGKNAGTSLRHPHSQIISLGVETKRLRNLAENAKHYFEEYNVCPWCDQGREEGVGQRFLAANEHFRAFIPFAAKTSFEIRVVPKRHFSDFAEINEVEKHALAEILPRLLKTYRSALHGIDYNYVAIPLTPHR